MEALGLLHTALPPPSLSLPRWQGLELEQALPSSLPERAFQLDANRRTTRPSP